MYRVTHGLAPTYLTELCEQCSKTRLHSASRGDYILPRSRLRCVDSSFFISAPIAWNSLPAHIRSCTSLSQFLSKLKVSPFHHLFPCSVVSSHIVHIPCSGLILFSFLFLLLFSMFVFISVWCHYVWHPRALVVRCLSKSTDLIWFLIWYIINCGYLLLLYSMICCCCQNRYIAYYQKRFYLVSKEAAWLWVVSVNYLYRRMLYRARHMLHQFCPSAHSWSIRLWLWNDKSNQCCQWTWVNYKGHFSCY